MNRRQGERVHLFRRVIALMVLLSGCPYGPLPSATAANFTPRPTASTMEALAESAMRARLAEQQRKLAVRVTDARASSVKTRQDYLNTRQQQAVALVLYTNNVNPTYYDLHFAPAGESFEGLERVPGYTLSSWRAAAGIHPAGFLRHLAGGGTDYGYAESTDLVEAAEFEEVCEGLAELAWTKEKGKPAAAYLQSAARRYGSNHYLDSCQAAWDHARADYANGQPLTTTKIYVFYRIYAYNSSTGGGVCIIERVESVPQLPGIPQIPDCSLTGWDAYLFPSVHEGTEWSNPLGMEDGELKLGDSGGGGMPQTLVFSETLGDVEAGIPLDESPEFTVPDDCVVNTPYDQVTVEHLEWVLKWEFTAP